MGILLPAELTENTDLMLISPIIDINRMLSQ